jgi:hypothetical protein
MAGYSRRLAQHRKHKLEEPHENPGSSSVYGRGPEHLGQRVDGTLREQLSRGVQANDGIRALARVVGTSSLACVAAKGLIRRLVNDARSTRLPRCCLCVAVREAIV